jgi:hypothetical protein
MARSLACALDIDLHSPACGHVKGGLHPHHTDGPELLHTVTRRPSSPSINDTPLKHRPSGPARPRQPVIVVAWRNRRSPVIFPKQHPLHLLEHLLTTSRARASSLGACLQVLPNISRRLAWGEVLQSTPLPQPRFSFH